MNNISCREHFNLYYIFLEDKQNNLLNENKAVDLFKSIESRINREYNAHSPPPE